MSYINDGTNQTISDLCYSRMRPHQQVGWRSSICSATHCYSDTVEGGFVTSLAAAGGDVVTAVLGEALYDAFDGGSGSGSSVNTDDDTGTGFEFDGGSSGGAGASGDF